MTENRCPTCLNHHPANFLVEDVPGSYLDREGNPVSWMSESISISSLQVSATHGCNICSIIYRGLSSASPNVLRQDQRIQIVIQRDHFRVSFPSKYSMSNMWTYWFKAGPDVQPPWHTLQQPRNFPAQYTSESCIQRIRSWIKTCEEKHSHHECAREASVVLPKRVLAIHNDPEEVSLYETNGQKGVYIALSHRWGSTPAVTTKWTNIEQFIQGIELESLPQTFKDVISFARRLGIMYVWIDSLCIIQDSASDWEIESSKMASIYADAYLVLVAASADGDTSGFLHERPQLYQGIPLESVQGSGTYEILMQHIMPHQRRELASVMPDSAIEDRAWIMQETVLARRALYFYSSEMTWECNSDITCECEQGPRHIDAPYPSTTGPIFRRVANNFFPNFDDSHAFAYKSRPFAQLTTAEAAYAEWRLMIVPMYSRKCLTKINDRLPALSGLAARLKDHLGDKYIAGIWHGDVHLSLLWYAVHSQEQAPSIYLAPSFSWVSVGKAVQYLTPHQRDNFGAPLRSNAIVEVLDVETTIEGANPLGIVRDGFLRLKGFTRSLTLALNRENSILECNLPHRELLWAADTPLTTVQLQYVDDGPAISINRSIKPQEAQQHSQAPVVGLLLADAPPKKNCGDTPNNHNCVLLVLGRSTTRSGAYQRLGLAVLGLSPIDGRRWLDGAEVQELLIV